MRIHPLSDVKTNKIGENTSIWQYCVIFEQATIGSECNINAFVLIENDVVIGNRVTIKSGVQIWDGVRIEDNAFIGPNVSFSNDVVPRSKNKSWVRKDTLVKFGASIGANATILPGAVIGRYALVGAGSVVTKDVPDHAVVVGNPAKQKGWVTVSGIILNSKMEDKLGIVHNLGE